MYFQWLLYAPKILGLRYYLLLHCDAGNYPKSTSKNAKLACPHQHKEKQKQNVVNSYCDQNKAIIFTIQLINFYSPFVTWRPNELDFCSTILIIRQKYFFPKCPILLVSRDRIKHGWEKKKKKQQTTVSPKLFILSRSQQGWGPFPLISFPFFSLFFFLSFLLFPFFSFLLSFPPFFPFPFLQNF